MADENQAGLKMGECESYKVLDSSFPISKLELST
jgi:hypothetical protein